MAWRFKVSKYKNSAPKFPKKEEVIQDVPVGNMPHSCGNHIKASCVYMAFNTDSSIGGSLGYLPLNAQGRIGGTLPYIHAHGDFVADFDFSPFDDYMLATGSQDHAIKVWVLPEEGEDGGDIEAAVSLPSQSSRIENVLWNPIAEGVLAVTMDTTVKVFDVAAVVEKSAFSNHGDQVQAVTWKGDGSLLATTCRDKKMRVIDPRGNTLVQELACHQNTKDTRIQWLGNSHLILSSGFGSSQEREVKLWDSRNPSSALATQHVQGSTGPVMCFFDEDTNMIFLAGKSDSTIRFVELTDKSPYLTEGMSDGTGQIKGAALVPKRAMDVMSGEVDRLLLMLQGSIVPVPYIVPRKTYRDFHSDLYPDTASGEPALTAQQWFGGSDATVAKVTVSPNKSQILRERRGALFGSGGEGKGKAAAAQVVNKPAPSVAQDKPAVAAVKPAQSSAGAQPAPDTPSNAGLAPNSQKQMPPAEPAKPAKVLKGFRQSKYRYIGGKTLHASHHLTNMRNVCKSVPHDSDLFVANHQRCAVPLDGTGGVIAVLELDKPGRLGDTAEELPTLQNGSKVADLAFDPFDPARLVVACDNTRINVWRVPPEGLPVGPAQTEPEFYLLGHMEKIYFVRFHPLVKDIVMTASYDMTVRMWNLDTRSEVMQLQGHEDQVFCLAWSPCGKYCVTVCKDGKIRVFDPRTSTHPIREGAGPKGTRSSRVVWVLGGRYIVVSAFESTTNKQQLSVYGADNLQSLGATELQVSPAVLIPHYDVGSSTLFLHSRGERVVYNFEVSADAPHLFGNTTVNLQTQHQGLAFLPPNRLDVRAVEVARGWRLTTQSIEPVSFTVPRVKMEYFQDDLYPDIPVTWEAALSAQRWLGGEEARPRTVSLRPPDMKPLSEAPVEAPKQQKYESFTVDNYKSDKEKKDELVTAMVGKLELSTEPLPQDLAEGVDDDEWDD